MFLLIAGIAGNLNDLHPVHQRPGNGLKIIGSGDKQHLRQIHRQLHVMIGEPAVLLGIQYLQKGGGSVSLVIAADLVDLIQQHQRILHAGLDKPRRDSSRHGPHIRSPVSPDLRLIPDASQGNPHIFFIQGSGHGPGDGSFSRSRRAHQTENGAFPLLRQRTDCQELHNPLLHFIQPVMVRLQHLPGFLHIPVVPGCLVPGQLQQGLDITPHHLALGIVVSHILEPADLLGDLLLDFPGGLQLLHSLQKAVSIGDGGILPQLLPDQF